MCLLINCSNLSSVKWNVYDFKSPLELELFIVCCLILLELGLDKKMHFLICTIQSLSPSQSNTLIRTYSSRKKHLFVLQFYVMFHFMCSREQPCIFLNHISKNDFSIFSRNLKIIKYNYDCAFFLFEFYIHVLVILNFKYGDLSKHSKIFWE